MERAKPDRCSSVAPVTARWLRVAVVRLHDVLYGGGGLGRARSRTAAGVWSPVTRVKSSTGADLVGVGRSTAPRRPSASSSATTPGGKGWTARLQRHLVDDARPCWPCGTAARWTARPRRSAWLIGNDQSSSAGWTARWNGSTWTSAKMSAQRHLPRATWPAPARRSAWCPSSGGLSLRWNGSGWTGAADRSTTRTPSRATTSRAHPRPRASWSTAASGATPGGTARPGAEPSSLGSVSGFSMACVSASMVPGGRRPGPLHPLHRHLVGEPRDVRRDARGDRGPVVRRSRQLACSPTTAARPTGSAGRRGVARSRSRRATTPRRARARRGA